MENMENRSFWNRQCSIPEHLLCTGTDQFGGEGRLTDPGCGLIVPPMRSSRFSPVARVAAIVALSALLLVLLGANAELEAADEACVACGSCENTLESHHHCCTTCCQSHAAAALPQQRISTTPVIANPIRTVTTMAVTDRSSDTPYRPPRV